MHVYITKEVGSSGMMSGTLFLFNATLLDPRKELEFFFPEKKLISPEEVSK